MRQTLLVVVVSIAALLWSDGHPAGRAADAGKPEASPDLKKLRPGLSQAEVRELLGPPRHVARQILYRRYLEQWLYDAPNAVRVEFDCVRGKAPQILTVHPHTNARP
jgi:hypothetical protein